MYSSNRLSLPTAPGTAAFFIVVNGVPSQGVMVMIGDGIIGKHKTLANADLPVNSMPNNPSWQRRWKEFDEAGTR